MRVSKQPYARGGCCGRGRCSAWANHRLPNRVTSGELENAGKRGPGGLGKTDGLRGKGSSGVWHHGSWSTFTLEPGVWYSKQHAKGSGL